MRILLLTSALPYPSHQGGALRTFGLIRGLAEAGHKIILLSFAEPGILAPDSPLHSLCVRVETVKPPHRSRSRRLLDLMLTRQPDLARRLESAAFRRALSALLREGQFDLVQAESLEMAIYLDQVRREQPSARRIYDAFNAESRLQALIAAVETRDLKRFPAALYSQIQAGRIAKLEREICSTVDAVITVSEEDARALEPFARSSAQAGNRIHVLPNGIFTADYARTDDSVSLDLGEYPLVFTGKMDYRPNVDAMNWFVSSILPQVQAEFPEAKLVIVGQKPHTSLQAIAKPGVVEITGWVPAVQPFLHAAKVYVAPLRMGSGTRLKLLEAMAAGCAIVATPAAAEGLNAEVQSAMLLAEDADSFAQSIVRLLRQPALRQERGAQAQAVVRQHYDWAALTPCLLSIYKDVLRG